MQQCVRAGTQWLGVCGIGNTDRECTRVVGATRYIRACVVAQALAQLPEQVEIPLAQGFKAQQLLNFSFRRSRARVDKWGRRKRMGA